MIGLNGLFYGIPVALSKGLGCFEQVNKLLAVDAFGCIEL